MARPTGPGKTEVRTNPASLMLYNFDIDGDALKEEHKAFLRAEAIPKIKAGSGVSVIGLTDRKASAEHNQALSEKRVARTLEFLRAEVPSGFTLKQSTGFGEEAATREKEQDDTLNERFRAVLVFLSPAPAPVMDKRVIEVTAKSFIGVIGSNVGVMPGVAIVGSAPVPRQVLLDTMAKVTDAQFGENPVNAVKDKAYRLFSRCRFSVLFENKIILSALPADIPDLDTDVGTEPPKAGLQPPDLIASNVTISPKGGSFVTFSWSGKGRPHLAVEPGFQQVKARASVFIWHIVTGRIDVSSGTPVTTVSIRGSQFPSHRVFVDGKPAGLDQRQGPFSNLWVSDPADNTKVK